MRLDQADSQVAQPTINCAATSQTSSEQFGSLSAGNQDFEEAEHIKNMLGSVSIDYSSDIPQKSENQDAVNRLSSEELELANQNARDLQKNGKINKDAFDFISNNHLKSPEKTSAFINKVNSQFGWGDNQLYIKTTETSIGTQTRLELGRDQIRAYPTVSNKWPLSTEIQWRDGSKSLVKHAFRGD